MSLQGYSLLCCRFSFHGRDYGEKEEEESLELRTKDDSACNGRGPTEVAVSQPVSTVNGLISRPEVPEERRGLISLKKSDQTEKNRVGLEQDADFPLKGWMYRDVQESWIRQRRQWFVLTQDSLDCYSGQEKSSRRLGSLVLTSLCSVIWPDKQTYKETGYWSVTVYGRKHCYRLFTKHFNEAIQWACAIQKVTDSKAPVETPTQLLIRDIEKSKSNQEAVEQIYQKNPILRYTQSPLYAPLLPFPYGSFDHTYHSGKGYGSLRDEAVKLFNSLPQPGGALDPVLLIQGVLQTCQDLRPLRDEVCCQLVKQTSGVPTPDTPTYLRYWQMLTCMSCTFLPGTPVLSYLRFHLHRVQRDYPSTEVGSYASFIQEALAKTRCRENVPSCEEIQVLVRRQELQCTVHHPGPSSCRTPISSHTTADELVKKLMKQLGLQESRNAFALFERSGQREQVIGGSTIIADVLTGLSSKSDTDTQKWLYFKLYCFIDTENILPDSLEYTFLFEQCHEMVVRGQFPAPEEDLQTLAALRLQSLFGDFSTHSPCPPLDELFPGHVVEARVLLTLKTAQPPPDTTAPSQAPPPGRPPRFRSSFLAGALWSHASSSAHKQKAEQDLRLRGRLKEEGTAVMGAILEHWKGLVGYSQLDSMAAYLNIAKRWPGFGCTLYDIDFYISSTGSFCQKLWLGVGATSLSLYRQGEAEAMESLPFSQICSYGASDSSTFKVTAGDRDLLFETSKPTEIMQLMNAYLNITHQQQGQEVITGSDEGFHHIPAVLELPSHLV